MYKTHNLTIDGHTMVALEGNDALDGVPVFLIHGISCSVRFFVADLLPVFAEKCHWYSLSLPGHYPAAFPPGFQADDLTPDLIAHLTVTSIRRLVGERPVLLVGHSTGGFAALNAAAHDPNCAQAVLSLAGFAHGRWTGVLRPYQILAGMGWPGHFLFKRFMRLFSSTPERLRSALRLETVDRRAYRSYPHLDQVLAAWYPDFSRLNLDDSIKWFSQMPLTDITSLLPSIQIPVTAMTGAQDPVVPPEQARIIAESVPGGELVTIDGCGHFLMWEKPDEFCRLVTGWVERWL